MLHQDTLLCLPLSRWDGKEGTSLYKDRAGSCGVGSQRGGSWRGWSLFFCDHLHQVDIRRVYSGVCNCILLPVLHCRPWKWNLINPDQFLMYKMNWQRFKKGGATIPIRWMIYTAIFCSANDWGAHHHHLITLTFSVIILHWIYFPLGGGAFKYVCLYVCVCSSMRVLTRGYIRSWATSVCVRCV